MRIGLAQIKSFLGDFQTNGERIIDFSWKAHNQGCHIVVFPELTLFGCHPSDLLERPSLVEDQNQVLNQILPRLPSQTPCLMGAVTFNNGKRGKPFYNSALWIQEGKIKKIFSKQLLPVYDVFDESRHFSTGQVIENTFSFQGKKIQILICEDMWGWNPIHLKNPLEDIKSDSIDLIINLSASPFNLEKSIHRQNYAKKTAKKIKAPLIYVNMVGGQDELIFDGGSFVMDERGELALQGPHFKESLSVFHWNPVPVPPKVASYSQKKEELLYKALVLGIEDYVRKTGFEKAHLGLSGGIDSAVLACLAVEALGSDNVSTLYLPTKFNNTKSLEWSRKVAEHLKCQFYSFPIDYCMESLLSCYEKVFGISEFSTMHENLQSRIRGVFLMMFSNQNNSLLLSAGNKTEYATGYTSLYGDMCGGLAPLGDLLKKQIYQLAHYCNKEREKIPKEVIQRAPSAELNFGQKDTDTLPSYDILDPIVEGLICHSKKPENKTERWALESLFQSEFKRWQAPPILRVSSHAFGQGRRMPIAHGAKN